MKLSEALNGYFLNISSGGFSTALVTMNRQVFKQFQEHFGDIEVESITTENLLAYQTFLMKRISASSVKVHWRCHRSFFKWAEKELKIGNPQVIIEPPRYRSKEIYPFSQEQVKALLKASSKSRRNTAMILLLLDSGVRVSEMCRLEIKDYDANTGEIRINPFETGLKSRPRTVYLGLNARNALWRYLSTRDGEERKDRTAPLIGTIRQPHSMERRSVDHILERIGEEAGVENVHAHRFRHTFAIEFLRNGGDIFTLQRILGHATLMMVRHYLTLADSDASAAHRKASPADRWKL
jgi:integrase/recombinase XerD